MDYIYLPILGSLLGTITIILIYIYLYIVYRERYIGIWTLSWLLLLSRFAIFDSGILSWKQSYLGVTTYGTLTLVSTLLFLLGTHIFANKSFNMWWIYSSIIILIVNAAINIINPFLQFKLFLPIVFCCFIGLWIGIIFIKSVNRQGIGHLITGYAFILWSILSISLPFTINGWWSSIAYILGGILRLTIAVGTLVAYFEKTRANLVNNEKKYRLLAENAIDIIYRYQLLPEAKLEYISPAVFTATGYKPEEYYSDNTLFFKVIHPEDRYLVNKFINDLPHSLELTLRLVRKDNTTLWIEQKCVPIYNKMQQITALEGIIRDITARKKLEQMSTVYDRMNMVGSMAATVAHEIRNPMTTVRGYLQVLSGKVKYQADKDKFNLMIEEIDRANSIIREYLSLSREKAVNFKQYSLNDIIEALFPLIQADASSAKIFLKLDLAEIPALLLDENAIRQLLLNLVRNSIEAMTTGGNLSIRTFLENDNVVLTISDQGSGIPAHILENLGTPFLTTKETGTGLGLPICYQIIHKHNAIIKVDTSPTGTTFLIYFKMLT
ncbi:MAG: PAS domain-containing protein [Pelosinus sp.]|nr:PAS domain-containing protein [Pelosinus sp.]